MKLKVYLLVQLELKVSLFGKTKVFWSIINGKKIHFLIISINKDKLTEKTISNIADLNSIHSLLMLMAIYMRDSPFKVKNKDMESCNAVNRSIKANGKMIKEADRALYIIKIHLLYQVYGKTTF